MTLMKSVNLGHRLRHHRTPAQRLHRCRFKIGFFQKLLIVTHHFKSCKLEERLGLGAQRIFFITVRSINLVSFYYNLIFIT